MTYGDEDAIDLQRQMLPSQAVPKPERVYPDTVVAYDLRYLRVPSY